MGELSPLARKLNSPELTARSGGKIRCSAKDVEIYTTKLMNVAELPKVKAKCGKKVGKDLDKCIKDLAIKEYGMSQGCANCLDKDNKCTKCAPLCMKQNDKNPKVAEAALMKCAECFMKTCFPSVKKCAGK